MHYGDGSLSMRYAQAISEEEKNIVINVCPVEGNIFESQDTFAPTQLLPPIHGIITFDKDFPCTAPSVKIRHLVLYYHIQTLHL